MTLVTYNEVFIIIHRKAHHLCQKLYIRLYAICPLSEYYTHFLDEECSFVSSVAKYRLSSVAGYCHKAPSCHVVVLQKI